MPFQATVYNVMVACPSDVETAWTVATDVLRRWNAMHSYEKRVVLLPMSWRTHSHPEIGERPQGILNRQLIKKSDLLVAVFWTRIGTATEEAESGTVEEIHEHRKQGKPVMIYFCEKDADLGRVDLEQYAKVKVFRSEVEGLYDVYKDEAEFQEKLERHLSDKVREDPYFSRLAPLSDSIFSGASNTPPSLSPEAKELLDAVVEDGGEIVIHNVIFGKLISTGQRTVPTQEPRDRAKYEALIEDLESRGFIKAVGSERELFRVTGAGYKFIDEAKQNSSTIDRSNGGPDRQAQFSTLSQSLGNVTSEKEISKMPLIIPQVMEVGLGSINLEADTDGEFLDLLAKRFGNFAVPVDDRFRRQSLFRALSNLLSSSPDSQRRLFTDALNAQIHDRAARMLIIKSSAEADGDTLRIYGEIGIRFEVLNELPTISRELARRFGGRNS